MDTTLYVSLSHQAALRRHMDLIANNIANANTTAFRREQIIFQEFLLNSQGGPNRDAREVAFVEDYGVARDNRQGALVNTGNDLDIAIIGQGFLQVEHQENAELLYTRNGRLGISPDGYLVTNDGHRVLNGEGQPFTIGAQENQLSIAEDGTFSSNEGVKGRIGLFSFENEGLMRKVGDSLYRSEEPPLAEETSTIQSGTLEGSNVNSIREMTDMISIMRSYQSTAKMLDKYQDMRMRGIERLGRVQ